MSSNLEEAVQKICRECGGDRTRMMDIVRAVNRKLSGIQKTFRFVMSHRTGKIEVLDVSADDRVIMRYHQNSDPDKIGHVFSRPYRHGACWLDDLPLDQDDEV